MARLKQSVAWPLAVRKQRDELKRRVHEADQQAKSAERELRMREKELELARRSKEKAAADAAQQAEKAAAARAQKLQELHKEKVRLPTKGQRAMSWMNRCLGGRDNRCWCYGLQVGKLEASVQELEKKAR